VTIGAANTPDRDAAAELLEEHAIGEDQPEIVGYSAYADAATRASLEEQGFAVKRAEVEGAASGSGRPSPYPHTGHAA
jgi:hypothetical protein